MKQIIFELRKPAQYRRAFVLYADGTRKSMLLKKRNGKVVAIVEFGVM